MMAVFFAIAGGIVVLLAYWEKRSFHKEMVQQRADEAALEKRWADFRAEEIANGNRPD